MNKNLLRFLLLGILLATFPAISDAQSWTAIGNESQIGATASNYTSIVTADVNKDSTTYASVPHVAFTESNIAKVKRYINGAWESVGGNVSDGNASYTYIFADSNGKLYVSYVDASSAGGNRLAVKTYNTETNAWEALGGNVSNLYLSSGSILQNIDSSRLGSSHNSWIAFDSSDNPYVVFSEFGTNGGHPFVKRFTGTSWEVVGSGEVSTDRAPAVGIAFDKTGTVPYIVYNVPPSGGYAGPLKLYRYTGNTWENIAVPDQVNGATSGATGSIRHTSLTIDSNNNLYIAYFNTGNGNKATVIKYIISSAVWSLSGAISGKDCPNINIIKSLSDDLYVSFIELTSPTAVKVKKLPAGSTTWTDLLNGTAVIDDNPGNVLFSVGANGKEYVTYTKTNSSAVVTPIVKVFSTDPPPPSVTVPDVVVTSAKQMEYLTRAVVATRINTSQVLVSWRLLGTDPATISFNVYRNGAKVNASPITSSTNYVDNISTNGTYTVKQVINGVEDKETSPVSVWANNILNIPIQQPTGGTTPDNVAYTYVANDASVGDVDGDGQYEIILKWDPTNAKDNSQSGYTGNVYLDAYKLNGTRLWRIDLGRNIRAGAHYTQFMVYDFDGDGKAEVACKTADGTVDGTGVVIGNATADYRSSSGYVLSGPEFLTMFNGLTGKAMSTVDFVPGRGTVNSWGDSYGNRVDRFISAVAYLDGVKPSLIMGRGYYTRLVRTAWDFVDGKLKQRWVFDSNVTGNSKYFGQGNHQMSVADVDGDGKQEILNGSSVINDNGTGLWTDSKGHGDALHVTDMDPSTPEIEEWMNHEDQGSYTPLGLRLKNTKTGETLWGLPTTGDVGRSMAGDIDPNYPGYEVWGSGSGGVYSVKGALISTNTPSVNFGLWWDGDLSREILDGTKLDKWNASSKTIDRLYTIYNAAPISSNNGTKSTPCLTADILGDWREEMVLRATDNQSLYLFTTPYVTDKRIFTLMHDPQYRVAVAWQNSAYNQPPYPGFFLGTNMTTPTANVYTVGGTALPINLTEFKAKVNGGKVELSWITASEINNKTFTVERSVNGQDFVDVVTVNGAGNSNKIQNYAAVDYSPLVGTNYYRLRQTDVDGKSTTSGVQAVTILQKETGLILSPNPVDAEVKLKLNSISNSLVLSLASVDGKLLLTARGSLDEVNSRVNGLLPSLNAGVYVVKVVDGDKIHTTKLIKK